MQGWGLCGDSVVRVIGLGTIRVEPIDLHGLSSIVVSTPNQKSRLSHGAVRSSPFSGSSARFSEISTRLVWKQEGRWFCLG